MRLRVAFCLISRLFLGDNCLFKIPRKTLAARLTTWAPEAHRTPLSCSSLGLRLHLPEGSPTPPHTPLISAPARQAHRHQIWQSRLFTGAKTPADQPKVNSVCLTTHLSALTHSLCKPRSPVLWTNPDSLLTLSHPGLPLNPPSSLWISGWSPLWPEENSALLSWTKPGRQ